MNQLFISTILLGLCFLLSALITKVLVGVASRRGLVAEPNARSSHNTVVATGGGIAIVVAFFLVVAAYYGWQSATKEALQGELGFADGIVFLAAVLIALVGLIDDRRHVPAAWRLATHIFAVAVLLALSKPLGLAFISYELSGVLFTGVVAVALIWLVNLFNFMDGIDGIAAIEVISVLAGAALIMWLNHSVELVFLVLALASTTLGFLVFNWPPAKIFMGDAGSGFLGFMLGVLAVMTVATESINLWSWLILLAVFVSDATVTLLRRWFRRERIYRAHRSHAYQILSRRWSSHKRVTLLALAINLCWLLPLAYLSSLAPDYGALISLVAYLPLVLGVHLIGAGIIND